MAALRTPSGPHARPGWADLAVALALVAAALAVLLLFRHRDGIADADALDMAAGMAHGLQPGVRFRDTLMYGRLISPGAYLAFHWFYPLLFHDPTHTIGFLNAVGLAAMALLPWPLYMLYRWRFAPAVAANATWIVTLTPLVWGVGCSFHPIAPAVLLLLLAVHAHARRGATPAGLAWFAAGAALGFAGLCLRAEIALAAPALLLAALLAPGRWRALAAAAASIALAVAGFVLVAGALAPERGGGARALSGYGAGFIDRYLGLGAIAHTLVWVPLAMGVATAAVAIVAAWRRRRIAGADRTAVNGLLVATLAWASTVLFWLPNRVFVPRHYLLAVPALVWIAAELAMSRTARSRLGTLAAAIAIANLLVPEVLYAAWNLAHPGRTKWPNGTFLSARARDEIQIHRTRGLAGPVLARHPAGAFFQVDWAGLAALLYDLALRPQPFALLSEGGPIEGARFYRYRVEGAEIRVLLIQPAWLIEPGPYTASARACLAGEIEAARRDGLEVVLPREIAGAGVLEHPPDSVY